MNAQIELNLTTEECQAMRKEFNRQKANTSLRHEAFRKWYDWYLIMTLPKLDNPGPITLTLDEANFFAFILGGLFAHAKLTKDTRLEKLHLDIAEKFELLKTSIWANGLFKNERSIRNQKDRLR